jgi:hypothetical protein
MLRTVLVYGNCQAGVYADLLTKMIGSDWNVVYLRNFDHPTEQQMSITPEVLESCTLVLEQVEAGQSMPELIRRGVRATTLHVRFPPLDLNLLWPFNFNDPRNVSEPPEFPFGRFPYGDRIVVELLREGLTGEPLWTEYQSRSVAKLPDLRRLKMHEERRLTVRDERSDVKIASIIMSELTRKKLFWTINHPTGWLLGRVFGEILALAEPQWSLGGDVREKADQVFNGFEPFGHQDVPIHPEVARQLDLQWWSPDYAYRYLDGSLMTFEPAMLRYIDFK